MKNPDNSSLIFRLALKWLGVDHKVRLGFGVMLGLILDGGRSAAAAYWADAKLGPALDAFGSMPCWALGVVLAFAPLFLWKTRVVGESYKAVFDTVDEIIARAHLSPQQRRIVYNALLQKVQQEFSPERPIAIGKLAKAAEKAVQEVSGESVEGGD